MSDNQREAPVLAGAADRFVAVDDDDAWNYWVDQARRLNTAKLRTLTDHFRRDSPAAALHRY